MKTRGFLAALTISIALVSCGEESTGPVVPELTSSTLNLAFTGDSSKIGMEFNASSILHPIPSRGSQDQSTGSKGDCEVTASWTICPESSFHSYILYRSENPGIPINPSSAEVLGVFTDPNTVEFIDDEIDWATKYYYALRTSDSDDNSVWSNEDSLTTPGTAPTPSILSIEDSLWNHVDLVWTVCGDSEFLSYLLFRSDFPDIAGDSSMAECLGVFSASWDTTYSDIEVVPDETVYYSVLTENTKGLGTWSNEVTLTIPSAVPDSIIATVDITFPWGICALPSEEYVYVCRDQDLVSVIRTIDNTVVKDIVVDGINYGDLCALPSGDYVYLTCYDDNTVKVIRTSDNTVYASINIGAEPVYIDVLPSGDYVYVSCHSANEVYVIRTSNQSVAATIPVGNGPSGVAVHPTGDYVYTVCDNGYMYVIDTNSNEVTASIPVGSPLSDQLCCLPSGDYVYVCSFGSECIYVVDASTNTVHDVIDLDDNPLAICAMPSSDYVYVSLQSNPGVIEIIRTSNNQIVESVQDLQYTHYLYPLASGTRLYASYHFNHEVVVFE